MSLAEWGGLSPSRPPPLKATISELKDEFDQDLNFDKISWRAREFSLEYFFFFGSYMLFNSGTLHHTGTYN